MKSSEPRSIAEVIRSFGESELTALFEARPDLMTPRPVTIDDVIERAVGAASTKLAIERLNVWQLRVLIGLAARVADTSEQLAVFLSPEKAPVSAVEAAVSKLSAMALVWAPAGKPQVTLAVRNELGPWPAGLADESTTPLDQEIIKERLAELPDQALEVLERLTWGPPTGSFRGAGQTSKFKPSNPIERCIEAGLLRVVDSHTVILPREVSWFLRDEKLFRTQMPTAIPKWVDDEPSERTRRICNQAGLGSAIELISHALALVNAIEQNPPARIKTGAMAKVDALRLSRVIGDEFVSHLILELLDQAKLIGTRGNEWLPTEYFDDWAQRDSWSQWLTLKQAWENLESWGESNVLAANPKTEGAAALRREALSQLVSAPNNVPVSGQLLVERIRWARPSWKVTEVQIETVLAEATTLGLLAGGRRTSLVTADSDPGFGRPTDRIVVQQDLSAVAAGPLDYQTMRVLHLISARVSHGSVAVRRFTEATLRRAMDSGWSGDEILTWVGEHSITPVPDTLKVLIDDVKRQFGRVEITPVSFLLATNDESTTESVLQADSDGRFEFTKLGPTLLAASGEAQDLVSFLHDLGIAPVATDRDGNRQLAPNPRRAAVFSSKQTLPDPENPKTLASAVLKATSAHPATTVKTLLAAQSSGSFVDIKYLSDQGTPIRVLAKVLEVSSGASRIVPKTSRPLLVPLARIMSVSLAKDAT